MRVYNIRKKNPVARFFYKGSNHSHPVRRTILVICNNKDIITGYEIRNGDTVVSLEDAPIKSYRKDRIPNFGDYWRLRRYGRDPQQNTLTRVSMANLNRIGA